MLTRKDNERLCRVEGDAPMGRMLRRYWLPALLSDELAADGPPKRVRLLGENLVAFRDSQGRVGLLDENCPHRGASLALARNENCALQCLYHGWKIDAGGHVLETPAEPEESNFAGKVRTLAYPAVERGGMIWTYLGPHGTEPPLPDFEWMSAPPTHRLLLKVNSDCNWMQALEGVVDSSHSGFLHSSEVVPAEVDTTIRTAVRFERPSNDVRPKMDAETTPYGFRYAAIRRPLVNPEENVYVRVTLFVAPFHGLFPPPQGFSYMQTFMPVDDTHTMFYFAQSSRDEAIDEEARRRTLHIAGLRPGLDIDADFQRTRRRENDWLQDRNAMRGPGASFSGIYGVQNQDMAVQESMGPLYDRSKEHLGASDVAVIRLRRLLLDSLAEFEATGAAPIGLREPFDYAALRSEERIIPKGLPWQSCFAASAGMKRDASLPAK
jgi:phthalate 4,5-dioxygenase oxygenase subunit